MASLGKLLREKINIAQTHLQCGSTIDKGNELVLASIIYLEYVFPKNASLTNLSTAIFTWIIN